MNLEQFKAELDNDPILNNLNSRLDEAMAEWNQAKTKSDEEIKVLRSEFKAFFREREKLLRKAQARDRMIAAIRQRYRILPPNIKAIKQRIMARKMTNINKYKRAVALAAGYAAMNSLKIKK